MFRLGRKAQTTLEYSILIALVVGAVVAMQVYVKRGIQGRIRNVVDHTGAGGNVGGSDFAFTGEQYEPYYLTSTANSEEQATNTQTMARGGSVVKTTDATTGSGRTQTLGWNGEGGGVVPPGQGTNE